jgi:hypothetical protein
MPQDVKTCGWLDLCSFAGFQKRTPLVASAPLRSVGLCKNEIIAQLTCRGDFEEPPAFVCEKYMPVLARLGFPNKNSPSI